MLITIYQYLMFYLVIWHY